MQNYKYIFIIFYLTLYILNCALGPHFIYYSINNKKLRIAPSIEIFLLRLIYITYLAILFNAYFFYKLNYETLFNAIIINIFATISFLYKYNLSLHNFGFFSHVILTSSLLFSLLFIKTIKKSKYKFGFNSIFTILIILFYIIFGSKLYDFINNLEKEQNTIN